MKQLVSLFFYFLLIYFTSRRTINELYFFLRKIFKNEKAANIFIALIFFPGTVIHELSHFFTAMILFLPVKDLQIFPKFEDNKIKLGSVYYVKKDFLRGFLVGIAPIFGAIATLWMISQFSLNILSYYFIFTISSTMFSSKKDLEDLIYLMPLVLLIAAVFYIFNIDINFLINKLLPINWLISFLEKVNQYLIISLFINVLIFVILKLLRKIVYS